MGMPLKGLGIYWLMPRTIHIFFCFQHFFVPRKEAKYGHIRADCFFSGRPGAWFNSVQQNKYVPGMVLVKKKMAKKSKKTSKTRSDTGKGPYKHNRPELWDRGSMHLHPAFCFFPIPCLMFPPYLQHPPFPISNPLLLLLRVPFRRYARPQKLVPTRLVLRQHVKTTLGSIVP